MTNTIEQVIAYARAHPTRDGGTWHNWCESFVWRAGGFNASFMTALAAGNASGPLRVGNAPRGAIHYWGGTSDGHVGFELGNDTILMASDGVTSKWGTALGTASLAAYNRNKPSMVYRGWTMRHGIETLAGTSTAGVGSITPLELDMALDNTDLIAILNAGIDIHNLGGGQARTLGQALSATYFYGDLLNTRITALDEKISAAQHVTLDDAAIKAIASAVTIDYSALAKAVNDDAARRLAS